MANLKEMVINGAARIIGTLYAAAIQTNKIKLQSSSSTTKTVGSNGQFIRSDGTKTYWGNIG